MITPGTLIVVGGPTASGKTHVAASIAKHYGTESPARIYGSSTVVSASVPGTAFGGRPGGTPFSATLNSNVTRALA